MSLIHLELTPLNLINSITSIVRPHRPQLPLRVWQQIESLTVLDNYFRNTKLVIISQLANQSLDDTAEMLALHLINGLKRKLGETANALRLWYGLMHMHTRIVRFAATKLMFEMINTLLKLASNELLSTEPPEILLRVAAQLWEKYLDKTWLDNNSFTRVLVAKNLCVWCHQFPSVFWTPRSADIVGFGMMEENDLVKNEYMRQIKHLPPVNEEYWSVILPILICYAQYDQLTTNRRLAIKALADFQHEHPEHPDLPSKRWQQRVLNNCINIEESGPTLEAALKLAWNDRLLPTLMQLKTTKNVGQAITRLQALKAWQEVKEELQTTPINESVSEVIEIIASKIDEKDVFACATNLVNANCNLPTAARLLKHCKPLNAQYFALIDRLANLNVNMLSQVFEGWNSNALRKGGAHIFELPRLHVADLPLAGWLNSPTNFRLAELGRQLLRSSDVSSIVEIFPHFYTALASLEDESLEEIEVALKIVVRICATLKPHCPPFNLCAIYDVSRRFPPLSNQLETQIMIWLKCLWKMGVGEDVPIDVNFRGAK